MTSWRVERCESRSDCSREAELGLDLLPRHVVVFLAGDREFGAVKGILCVLQEAFEDCRVHDHGHGLAPAGKVDGFPGARGTIDHIRQVLPGFAHGDLIHVRIVQDDVGAVRS